MEIFVICMLYLAGGITVGFYLNQIVRNFKRKQQGIGRWD